MIGRSTLAALALLAAAAASPASAQGSKPLAKVRIAVGTTLLNVAYPMLTLPGPLGYFKEEGYDVEVLPVGASLQALQQMVAGNAEFAQINASVVVQANAKNDLPVRAILVSGPIDWALGVDQDGPIKSFKDLKGKTIGVFSLATGGIAYFNNALRANGVDPKEVDLVPLGLGAPPVQALQSGRVQGLLYWAAGLASFENAGLKLRKIVGADWQTYPDFSLSTLQGTIDKDPALVAGITRAIVKATVFALANPDCARQVHWKAYPSTKPTGADEATIVKWDMNNLETQLTSFRAGFELNGGKVWGHVDPSTFERLSAFMVDAKLIDKPISGASLVASAIETKVSDFDRNAVEASAKACRF